MIESSAAQVSVSRTDLPAGGLIPPHRHAYPRYNYVLEGGVRVTNLDTGQVQEFRAGQFIVETVGQWHQGEVTLDQMFFLRPAGQYQQYKMPIPGLWLCGAGAHPGGNVSGAAGMNAAREILKSVRQRRAA